MCQRTSGGPQNKVCDAVDERYEQRNDAYWIFDKVLQMCSPQKSLMNTLRDVAEGL